MGKNIPFSDETLSKIAEAVGFARKPDPGEAMRICIVDNRGLTFVGRTNLERDEHGLITIYDARCIIRWGTTNHIAEIVKGPTSNTKLGAKETVRVDRVYVVYECGDKW